MYCVKYQVFDLLKEICQKLEVENLEVEIDESMQTITLKVSFYLVDSAPTLNEKLRQEQKRILPPQ